jgi:hypothetical protein
MDDGGKTREVIWIHRWTCGQTRLCIFAAFLFCGLGLMSVLAAGLTHVGILWLTPKGKTLPKVVLRCRHFGVLLVGVWTLCE